MFEDVDDQPRIQGHKPSFLTEYWPLMVLGLIVVVGFTLAFTMLAKADDPWGGNPPEWRKWFNDAQLTPEAKQRFQWNSCCNQADRVKTKYTFNDGTNEWHYWLNSKWNLVPDDVIHWEDDPTMPQQLKVEGVLFIYGGFVTCFWPPQTSG